MWTDDSLTMSDCAESGKAVCGWLVSEFDCIKSLQVGWEDLSDHVLAAVFLCKTMSACPHNWQHTNDDLVYCFSFD